MKQANCTPTTEPAVWHEPEMFIPTTVIDAAAGKRANCTPDTRARTAPPDHTLRRNTRTRPADQCNRRYIQPGNTQDRAQYSRFSPLICKSLI